MYRQGDLLIVKATEEQLRQIRPNSLRSNDKIKDGKHVLLEGETSGHYHGVQTETAEYNIFTGPLRSIFQGNAVGVLQLTEATDLTHVGHHDPIEMAPGMYFVVQQREFDPGVNAQSLSRPVFD